MRYRKLDSNGDYSFGRGALNFYIDSSAAVAQAIQTSLNLFQGEWFLDITAGVPWYTQVVGYDTQALYDSLIKDKIKSVEGVLSIISYTSTLDTRARQLDIAVQVSTIFGVVSISQTLAVQTGYGTGGYGRTPYGE